MCNEPVGSVKVRLDHLPTGGVITPLCKGSASLAENLSIEIELGHAQAEQERYSHKEVIHKL